MRTLVLLLALFILPAWPLHAQLCVNPGQTPSTALLVCGSEAFTQTTVQFCGQSTLPVPCPTGFTYTNKNPNYFRMFCYADGTLGFTITPADPNANFDWQLFDITSVNPDNIFTNPNLFVACNWSPELGETGASSQGNSPIVCAATGEPTFSSMPGITAGRTYMLVVLNQSNTTEPFDITFTGGTAVITDNVEPHLLSARLTCDGGAVVVRLNKDLVCTSLALDGSDFIISGGGVFVGTDPGDCNAFSGSDSIMLFLSQPILNGNYTLTIKNGTDGNTLLDNCHRQILENESIPVAMSPPLPTPMDSVKPAGCRPGAIDLVFRKPIRCNTIAPDGSDFIITGPQSVAVTGVSINCGSRNMTGVIRLILSTPIVTGGNYVVTLTTGTDGNTLADECGLVSAVGENESFPVQDTVSARFTVNILPSCSENSVSYIHSGGNGINSWQWDVGTTFSGNIPNPVINYPNAIQYNVKLTVSNGGCTDTYSQNVLVDNILKADFDAPTLLCPGDLPVITNTSTGNINYWEWDFGNGSTANTEIPPSQVFASTGGDREYIVRLIAGNTEIGCYDTVIQVVKAAMNCMIAVPNAFTPNNDGKNDFFYPLNAHNTQDYDFRVFNRNGEAVFISHDWTRKWDGKRQGIPQPPGVYVWMLSYFDGSSNKKVLLKGTVILIR